MQSVSYISLKEIELLLQQQKYHGGKLFPMTRVEILYFMLISQKTRLLLATFVTIASLITLGKLRYS